MKHQMANLRKHAGSFTFGKHLGSLRRLNANNAPSRGVERRNVSLNKTIAARRDVITVQATRC